MKFSIVIPTYNRGEFIAKVINSLLNQTYENFEILVIDDGSTDSTAEVVKKIKDERVCYYYKENGERGAARNYGAQKATGDYINFFDSDDLAYPNHLDVAFRVIQQYNNPPVFHLGFDIKNPQGEIIRTPDKIYDINKQLINGNVLSCNGVFLRKDIAEKHPFNEDRELSASEDYLLWLTLASEFEIKHDNTITSTILNHEQRSVLNFNAETLIIRKEKMLVYLFNDKKTAEFYNSYKSIFYANAYAYIALHAILGKQKKTGVRYFYKALKYNPNLLLNRKGLAIIKRLFL